jgi:GT2 family glycosyltransferase
MDGERLSVIISTHRGVANLESCLRALSGQRRAPDQLVIVDQGSLDGRPPTGAPGCQVIVLDGRPNISASRNAGAYAAEGEILAFIDSDSIVRPGWAEALRRAFADGAYLAGGAIEFDGPCTLPESYASRWRRHDETGRNGFLPFLSGTHLAIRRDVFLRLGGFDERAPVTEDVDLSLRAQLADFPILFVPEAELVHHSGTSMGGLLRERFRRARTDRMTERKFREFPFMRLDREGRVGRVFASRAAAQLMLGAGAQQRGWSLPLREAGIAAAGRLGALTTDLQLATRLVPLPGALAYRDPEQHNTSTPLPGEPAFLILGDDRLVLSALRLAFEGADQVAVAPPGLEREATRLWDEPAPWSMRLARAAVRAGWPLEVETTALRVEREQPRTWGEAFLTLHRVHAWAHARPRFGLAALGPEGDQLAKRLPHVPIVFAGQGDPRRDRIALRVTRRRLLREPRAVGVELMQLLAVTPGSARDTLAEAVRT